jgi:hypothetical protein
MKKLLRFEIKQNLRKPPRVYVRSVETKELYGSFTPETMKSFDGFEKLSKLELLELKQYMQNIKAIYKYLKPSNSNMLTDFRFRLPAQFVEMLDELTELCEEEDVELDIFDNMITSIIHQARISASKLKGNAKMTALALLETANIADFQKQTHAKQIQSVFTELQTIYNRSEKLHQKALSLFNKDKSYSPRAIEGMAKGETLPSKWLVACAIDLLVDEQCKHAQTLLTANDLYLLWGKPLFDSTYSQEKLIDRAKLLQQTELIEKIQNQYSTNL